MNEQTETVNGWGKCPHCKTNLRVRNAKFYCPKCDKEFGLATW